MRREHQSAVAQRKGTAVLTVGHTERNWAVRYSRLQAAPKQDLAKQDNLPLRVS
jgi:hypothetical protein